MRCWLTSVALRFLRLLRFCVVYSVEGLINQCEDLTRDLSEFRDLEFKMWKEDMTDALSVRGGKRRKRTRARRFVFRSIDAICFMMKRSTVLPRQTRD